MSKEGSEIKKKLLRLKNVTRKENSRSSAKPRWTSQHVFILEWYIGHKPLHKIAKLLGRTVSSVSSKANRIGTKSTRGQYTLRGAAEATGFDHHTLERARDELKQRWKRANTKRGAYIITDEQLADLLAYLCTPATFVSRRGYDTDRWAANVGVEKCIKCGVAGSGKEEQHWAYGLCYKCFSQLMKTKHLLNRFRILSMYIKLMKRIGIKWEGQPHPLDQIYSWIKTIPLKAVASYMLSDKTWVVKLCLSSQ